MFRRQLPPHCRIKRSVILAKTCSLLNAVCTGAPGVDVRLKNGHESYPARRRDVMRDPPDADQALSRLVGNCGIGGALKSPAKITCIRANADPVRQPAKLHYRF